MYAYKMLADLSAEMILKLRIPELKKLKSLLKKKKKTRHNYKGQRLGWTLYRWRHITVQGIFV